MADKYVVRSDGDNYDCVITTTPIEEVHNLLCCCGAKAEDCPTFKAYYLTSWNDKEDWSISQPGNKLDTWSIALEDGCISVARITEER